MKPSDVVLAVPPLTGTFEKSEAECAAALIIRALAATGDTWRPIMWEEITAVLRADMEAKTEPIYALFRNPFCRHDVYLLIDKGFVTAPVVDDKTAGPFEFTPGALDRLQRWNGANA